MVSVPISFAPTLISVSSSPPLFSAWLHKCATRLCLMLFKVCFGDDAFIAGKEDLVKFWKAVGYAAKTLQIVWAYTFSPQNYK